MNSRIPMDDLKFVRVLGKGGCGEVYLADSIPFGNVAVKKISLPGSDKEIEDFENEVRILSQMNSPFIIRFFGTVHSNDGVSIVMEYAANGSLNKFLAKFRETKTESSFTWEQRYQIASDITRGLLLMHSKGVVHRDMTSMNILLDENLRAKISDFGLSKIKTRNQTILGVTNNVCGSFIWKAPETYDKKNLYTEKADIYSIGIIFWEIATCQFPFEGMEPQQIMFHVFQGLRLEIPSCCPKEYKELIEQCWDHDLAKRPKAQIIYEKLSSVIKSQEYESDIFVASSKGSLTSIVFLVANGIDINEKYPNDTFDGEEMKNSTPIHFSAKYGHLSVIEYLVNHKADINAKDENNWTPLHYAARKGHLSVVEYLFNQKAEINAKTTSVDFLYVIGLLFIWQLKMVILVLLNI